MAQVPVDQTHIRPLTAHERIYWLLNFNMPIHPTVAAHIVGRTTSEEWRRALDQLQRRHPLLSVSIEAGPDFQLVFKRRTGATIPLQVVPLASVARWEAEMERELATPFAPGQAPLLRAVLLHAPERCILILSAAHSIADGLSLSYLVRDALTAMAGEELEPLGFPPSEEELLGFAPVLPGQSAQREDLSRKPRTDRGLPSVVSRRLSAPLTQKIRAVARRNQTTVHGALAAAFTMAMRRQVPRFLTEPVHIISPVNTRPILGTHGECGMYFTSPQAAFDPATATDFWDIARSARQGIIEAATREAVAAATTAMQGMIADGLTTDAAVGMFDNVFAMDLLLTNLGPTPYPSHFGELTLQSLWPAVLPGTPECQTVGAASTDDALCLLLTSYEPIPQLLESAEAVLREQCLETETA